MRVIGLDTSLTRTGIGVIDAIRRTTKAYSIETKAPKVETIRTRVDRITHVTKGVMDIVHGNYDDVMVIIESNAQSRSMGKVWDRAGLWWNIIYTLEACGIAYALCPPNTRAKWATGKGNAGKDEVMLAIDRIWTGVASNNDESDGLAMATMGAQWLNWPIPTKRLVRHDQSLSVVEWPTEDVGTLRWAVGAAVPGVQPDTLGTTPKAAESRTAPRTVVA